ncbi:hypothetical protein KUTeg_013509 [Tegillarca granosa]|uniref:F-box domain-containing protein n=1 Tax=Tegillarca granosa TaxID=220873 RepID=A0ABQ9EXT7_TEGGR|nr:hypothetical protein KUTeg_013509 [Tegillarca granosa]
MEGTIIVVTNNDLPTESDMSNSLGLLHVRSENYHEIRSGDMSTSPSSSDESKLDILLPMRPYRRNTQYGVQGQMPSSIISIEQTRNFSVKPIDGLRFGNFEGTVYLPPIIKDQATISEESLSSLNNRQIYKTICDWFESWRPWQQHILLCGIVDRCSIRQLDIIATTLEPVKHRDYTTAFKRRYPSTPFRLLRQSPFNVDRTLYESFENGGPVRTLTIGSASQEAEETVIFQDHGTSAFSLDNFAENLASNVLQSAISEIAGVNALDNLVNIANIQNEEENKKETKNEELKDEDKTPRKKKKRGHKNVFKNAQKNSNKNVVPLPKLVDDNIPTIPENSLTVKEPSGLARSLSQLSKSSLSRARYELFGKVTVSTPEFLSETKPLLGPVQREVKFSDTLKLPKIQNLPVPIEKSYKAVKFWPVSPHPGKVFTKPKKQELEKNYRDQLHEIWNWLNMWEDYEKITLLKEVLLLANPEVLSFLSGYIQTKLQYARDINRLHDNLLLYILSFLLPEEIGLAAQVCRRWRYLCAMDDLWMIKCHELEVGKKGDTSVVQFLSITSEEQLANFSPEEQELQRSVSFHLENNKNSEETKKNVIALSLSRSATSGSLILPLTPGSQKSNTSDDKKTVIADVPVKRWTISKLQQHEEEMKGEVSSDESIDTEDLDQYRDYVYQVKGQSAGMRSRKWKPEKSFVAATIFGEKKNKMDDEKPILPPAEIMPQDIPDEEREKLKRSKTDVRYLQTFVKTKLPGKKKREKEDAAFDIRTDLGKSSPSMQLEWRNEDQTTDENKPASRYMGVGHLNGVMCCQFDKRRLITAGLDRTVRIWDVRSGRSIHKFYGHKGGIHCLIFEYNLLLTGSWDTTIIAWDLRTFDKRIVLTQHSGCISSLQMNADYIVSGSHDMTVRVWHRRTFMCVRTISGHTGPIMAVTLHKDNIVSASTDKDGTVREWDLLTLTSVRLLQGHKGPVRDVQITSDRIVTGSDDGTVRIWDLFERKPATFT